jgi:REP element-mobilizing transposase RayT
MPAIEYPTRRSLRLREYDYRNPGVYFFTICVQDHRCIFGEILNQQMVLKAAGRIVWQCWHDLPHHFPTIQLDQFIVMPNHVHGVIILHRKPNSRACLVTQHLRPARPFP